MAKRAKRKEQPSWRRRTIDTGIYQHEVYSQGGTEGEPCDGRANVIGGTLATWLQTIAARIAVRARELQAERDDVTRREQKLAKSKRPPAAIERTLAEIRDKHDEIEVKQCDVNEARWELQKLAGWLSAQPDDQRERTLPDQCATAADAISSALSLGEVIERLQDAEW